MSDRYTKAVLTIIAAALVAIVFQNATGTLNAQSGIPKVQLCGYVGSGSDIACATMQKEYSREPVGVVVAPMK